MRSSTWSDAAAVRSIRASNRPSVACRQPGNSVTNKARIQRSYTAPAGFRLPEPARFWNLIMSEIGGRKRSRRDFIGLAASAAAVGPFFLFPERALAQKKTLKIAKWAHFVPEFDRWFEDELAAGWGNRPDTQVGVYNCPLERIRT